MGASDGGRAFPRPHSTDATNDFVYHGEDGMSLRDYFAAKAMHGYMAYIASMETASMSRSHNEIAQEAYSIADAMLAAREMKKS